MAQRRLAALTLTFVVLQPVGARAGARFMDFVEDTPGQLLNPAVAAVVSPDGAFVYAGSGGDHTITTFSRDAGTGTLVFAGAVQNGVGGITGLNVRAMALSPDGAHLYATGDYSVAVFSRDGGTGTLTWVETEQNGVGGVTNLNYALDIAVSPDGAHVYVVSQSYPSAVLVFSRNALTGALTFVEATVDGAPDGLAGAQSLAISSDGAHVYVAGYYDDRLVVFGRNAVSGSLTFVESETIDAPVAIALSPDGAHAYVASSPNLLSVYSRNAGTGELTFEQVWVDGVGGVTAMSGPSDVMVTPDGAHVYVTCWSYSDQALVVFSRNAGTGYLTFVEEHRDGVGGVVGLSNPNGVVASPDGANLYVTAGYYYYYPSSLTTWSRNAGSGAVAEIQHLTSDIGPSAIALSPDAAHLYGAEGDQISVYSRDGSTGSLTRESALAVADNIGGVDGLDDLSALVISSDGAHVYAAGQTDDAIAAFSRNASTGALTFVEVQRDGVAGVNGLDRPLDMVMSPNGAHLYVAAYYDDAVSVFSRNAGTGALTQTQVVQNGVGGVTGINSPVHLALTPDGVHLYVAAYDSLATFSRNAGTGALTFLGATSSSSFPEDGVSVSPDGAFVYVYNPNYYYNGASDVLRVFSRDATTGALKLVGRIKSNEGGLFFSSYYNTGRLVFSNDGTAAYLRGAIFARNPTTGSLGFLSTMAGLGYYSLGTAVALGPLGEVYSNSSRSVERYAPGYAGCEGGPLPVCRGSSSGQVILSATANYITWSWFAADEVFVDDFGEPALTDHYSLCMWDESGPTPTLILRTMAPAAQQCTSSAKPCWLETTTGFAYRDRFRTPEGIASLTMKAGAAGVASVKLVARKGNLTVPDLPLGVPVRIQLRSSAGACFESVYSVPGVNNGAAFSARAD